MAHSIGFISLGCAKNQVDCEQMMYLLRQAGYEIRDTVQNTDLVIINTCGFIDAANSEAIDNILMVGGMKEAGLVGKILVTGCLAQRYQDEVLKEMPEVDGVLGTGSYYDIVEAVEQLLAGKPVCTFGSIDRALQECGRVLTTPEHYAYIKIAEGCDNHCAYCVIPSLRGKFRSRSMEEILKEANALADDGVKELIVVAQDTSRYGMDTHKKPLLAELLKELCKIEKLHWIRVHYCYPDEMTEELIDTIAREPKIVKYLDIPIQHVSDGILKRMNRRGNKAYLEQLFPKLRERIANVVIRTSIITGLPGEGEAEFTELCEFLKKHKLERVGAFAFSPEEGTPAAKMEFADQETAVRRAEVINELQSRVMDAYNNKMQGQQIEVLCEGFDGEYYFGRTYADSPDIDGTVYFTSPSGVRIGDFVKVRICGVKDGDLTGEEE